MLIRNLSEADYYYLILIELIMKMLKQSEMSIPRIKRNNVIFFECLCLRQKQKELMRIRSFKKAISKAVGNYIQKHSVIGERKIIFHLKVALEVSKIKEMCKQELVCFVFTNSYLARLSKTR